MTLLAGLIAGTVVAVWSVAWFWAGWQVCSAQNEALHLDRDLHEQDSHIRRDAADRWYRHTQQMIDHPNVAARAHRKRYGSTP